MRSPCPVEAVLKAKRANRPAFIESLESRQLLSSVTLLSDAFNGSSINTAVWQQPKYSSGGTFLGRTQLQVAGNSPAPLVTGGSFIPNLQSYNPTQLAGHPSFWGTEILSKQAFTPQAGHTLTIQFRAKLNMTTGGGVLGLFLYTANPASSNDEVDTELESNQIANGANQVETNVYTAQSVDAGSPQLVKLPGAGAKLTGWHVYTMKLDAGLIVNNVVEVAPSISWTIYGALARTEFTLIPTHAMNLYINFWVPDTTWPEAYNAGIQPTTSSKQNQKWTADIDSVSVTSTTDAPTTTHALTITSLPPRGSAGYAIGTALGFNPASYQGVAVYIDVDGQWWTKPTFASPLTTIAPDGVWQANIDTGGADANATEVAAFLIPTGFDVPQAGGLAALPSDLFSLVHVVVNR